MYYYNVRYINIFVLKCIFLISAGGVACGCDLGRGQIFLLFLSLADHMPDKCSLSKHKIIF